MMEKPFDLTNVKFVKRITLGSQDPTTPMTESETEAAIALLNRCLSDTPKGKVIGMEKNFTVINMGEHQVVMQWIIYHIGFTRKPVWLNAD